MAARKNTFIRCDDARVARRMMDDERREQEPMRPGMSSSTDHHRDSFVYAQSTNKDSQMTGRPMTSPARFSLFTTNPSFLYISAAGAVVAVDDDDKMLCTARTSFHPFSPATGRPLCYSPSPMLGMHPYAHQDEQGSSLNFLPRLLPVMSSLSLTRALAHWQYPPIPWSCSPVPLQCRCRYCPGVGHILRAGPLLRSRMFA